MNSLYWFAKARLFGVLLKKEFSVLSLTSLSTRKSNCVSNTGDMFSFLPLINT